MDALIDLLTALFSQLAIWFQALIDWLQGIFGTFVA